MKTVDIYKVYKKCPKCRHDRAEYYNDQVKVDETTDWALPIEEHTVTYKSFRVFKCLSCGWNWIE